MSLEKRFIIITSLFVRKSKHLATDFILVVHRIYKLQGCYLSTASTSSTLWLTAIEQFAYVFCVGCNP